MLGVAATYAPPLRASMIPAGLKRASVANPVNVVGVPLASAITLFSFAPAAEGVASKVTENVPDCPAGRAVSVNAAFEVTVTHGVLGLTVRFTMALWVVPPFVPVMGRVEVPVAEVLVAMVSAAEPAAFTELELNVAVTPAGAPLTLSPTLPLKPLSAPTVTVELVLLPTITTSGFGFADNVKSFIALIDNTT